ncbi:unnamed protein product [Effrenium voratum]|uniref:alpha-amylase n=1 Tax=Effrenium voratum TaxID=2562239 RepID=A0AA36J7B1_9DINO|nr:unnamed protein product [Effrenium voratum]
MGPAIAQVGGTGSTSTTPMLSTTATSAWPSTSPFSNISSASNTQTTTLFSTTTTTNTTASTTTARTTTAGFFGLNGTSTTSTTGKFTTATTTKLSTPVSSNGTSTTNTWTTLFTTSPQPASAQTTTASTFVTTTTSTAFQPSGPLVAMPNCFLAPLVEKTGCQRLMVEEDARFGLNELQQETTARRICQESARALGANTWQFRVGRCEVWNCSSKAALQRSADSGRSGTEGLLLQDYKGRIVATGKEELVAEYDFVESLAVVVIQNPDSTAYLQGADGSYITMGLAVGLQQEAARWSLSAADDGVALFVEGQQLVVRSSRLELQPPAGAGAEGIFHLVPAGLQRAWGPDARVWVHSSWCQYQEPYGGEGGRQRRSATYVQLFEWSHAAVAKECQQLGAQGVDGVQLSPVTEHVVGDQWWVRYQPVSFSLNSRSGSAANLRHAVAACRSAGVEVVADVVLNHMARPCPEAENARLGTPCVGWNGTAYGNRRTAGARGWDRANTSFFHHQTGHDTWGQCGVGPETGFLCGSPVTTDCSCCPCDMYGLPDWDLAEPAVQEMHTRHLEELHSMGITMLRVDAALYMESELMSGILNRFPWDMVYQEWWHELPVPGREVFGLYRDLKFMRRAAAEMHDAAQVLSLQQGNFYIPAEDAVYPTCFQDGRSDAADPTVPTFKNGLAFHQQQKFLLASPFPTTVVLWSGYSWQSIEQGPPGGAGGEECMATPSASPLPLELASSRRWVCEHRWQGVAGLIHFRKACRKAITKSWAGACVGCGALRLGAGCFLALAGPDGWQLRLTTGLPGGRYCDLSSLENRTCVREVLLGDEGRILEGGVPAGDLLAISTTWML